MTKTSHSVSQFTSRWRKSHEPARTPQQSLGAAPRRVGQRGIKHMSGSIKGYHLLKVLSDTHIQDSLTSSAYLYRLISLWGCKRQVIPIQPFQRRLSETFWRTSYLIRLTVGTGCCCSHTVNVPIFLPCHPLTYTATTKVSQKHLITKPTFQQWR